ncbi:hypothetical protein BpHYR1_001417 [Brachionus plicatilis]|uniref:Uncharacterized protein n=1 Tax=Brachionus plicatilis TaxID=10195 RepID=A0A3M7RWK0_BRAPC|nr:hypothetical protein BpHYR1_001417 [Brachionus plicatilis]
MIEIARTLYFVNTQFFSINKLDSERENFSLSISTICNYIKSISKLHRKSVVLFKFFPTNAMLDRIKTNCMIQKNQKIKSDKASLLKLFVFSNLKKIKKQALMDQNMFCKF